MTLRSPYLPFLAASFFLLLQSVQGETKSNEIKLAVEEKVGQAKLPGMVAAITSSKGVLAIGSAGVRKNGADTKLTEQDHVHLGSCTKAMTSVLLATLVDEGKLTWETSLIAILPELKGKIHPNHHAITVWQLLTHRSGVEANAATAAPRMAMVRINSAVLMVKPSDLSHYPASPTLACVASNAAQKFLLPSSVEETSFQPHVTLAAWPLTPHYRQSTPRKITMISGIAARRAWHYRRSLSWHKSQNDRLSGRYGNT